MFSLLSIFLGVLAYYALKRINQYEEIILQFQNIVEISTQKMQEVDASGHYESDDETGFFFEQLKELQFLLTSLFEQEEENDAKEKK